MADARITDLPALLGAADDDVLLIIDVSDKDASAAGTDKKVTVARVRASVLAGLTTESIGALSAAMLGKPDGVARLNSLGQIPREHLPSITITDTYVVANEAEMLALDVGQGDVAIREDLSATFLFKGGNSAQLADWQELPTPTGVSILSVNGKTGVVQLSAEDIGAIPAGEKGAPSGVATLGEDGKLLPGQVPDDVGAVKSVNGQDGHVELTPTGIGAIPERARGAAGGVATLGEDGKVTPEQLPDVATTPPAAVMTVSPGAPVQARDGDAVTLNLSGESHLVGQEIEHFTVTWWDESSQDVQASAGQATASKTVSGAVGTLAGYSVTGTDSLGNKSLPVAGSILITANQPPVGPVLFNAPTEVDAGSTDNQISFTGATDPEGDPVAYEIVDAGGLQFSKTSGIADSEIVTFAAPGAAMLAVVSVRAVDDRGGQSAAFQAEIAVAPSSSGIIGVVLKATGGAGGTVSHCDVGGGDIPNPGHAWFSGHPSFALTEEVIDGQAMIRVPKFWYRVANVAAGANLGKMAWWIADHAADGFTVHPAFMHNGQELDCFWIGKYQASIDGAGKMQSVPGVLPNKTLTPAGFTSAAAARNVNGAAGFMRLSYWQHIAITLLYLVENATFNAKAKTGEGAPLAAGSSTPLAVDDPAVAVATYRGIVGLWGNIYVHLDGALSTPRMTFWDREGNRTLQNSGVYIIVNKSPVTFHLSTAPAFIGATGAFSNLGTSPDYQTNTNEYASDGLCFTGGGPWSLWTGYRDYEVSGVGCRLARV